MITTTLAFRSAFFLGASHLAGQAVTLHPISDPWLPRYGFEARRLGVRLGVVRRPSDARLPGGCPRFTGARPAQGRGGCADVLRVGPSLGDVCAS